jgi:hypothetical protein
VDRHFIVPPAVRLLGVRDVSVEADGDSEIVAYTVILLADIEVEGAVLDNDGHTAYTSTVLQDRLVVVDYEATLKDGQLGSVHQTGTATAHAAAERFDDSFDAYEWLRDTLDGWCGIEVEESTSAAGSFPEPFGLCVPTGRREVAEVVPSLNGDWTVGFAESGVEISAVYDPNARAWLGRKDSFDRYPPVSLQSELATFTTREPFTAIGIIWMYLAAPAK